MLKINSLVKIKYGSLFSRILIPFVVFIFFAFWPEKFNIISVFLACVFALLISIIASNNFSRIFLNSFVASSIIAYILYAVTAPIGDFAAPSQASGAASDSQYFLFEARRFIYEDGIDALFSTWGSFIPVIVGSGALLVFSDNYMGIVFLNSLLYSYSVLMCSSILNISNGYLKFLPLLGWLPLQALYNSMISKEPIYIFLIIFSVYIITKKYSYGKMSFHYWLFFMASLVLCMLLRPVAAIVVVFICIAYFAYKNSIRKVLYFTFILTIIISGVILLSSYLEYNLPIDISYDAIIRQIDFVESAAEDKGIASNLIWLFTPPWSLLFSPILSVMWMVSPLPLLWNLIFQIELIFSSNFTFNILATIIRYIDATLMAMLLSSLFIRMRHFSSFLINPLISITIFLLIATVSFQFLESGRHRYFPGFILFMVLLASKPFSKLQR